MQLLPHGGAISIQFLGFKYELGTEYLCLYVAGTATADLDAFEK